MTAIDREALIALLEGPDGVREMYDGSGVDVLVDRILALVRPGPGDRDESHYHYYYGTGQCRNGSAR